MARLILTSTVGSGVAASYGNAAEPNGAIAAAVALQPDPTAFAATLATLVADGAVPTQAHVTAVNNAYTTLAAAQTAYVAAVNGLGATVSADVVLLINGATVLTKNKFREMVRGLSQLVFGSSLLSGT